MNGIPYIRIPYAMYDAFSNKAFGGSQGVVLTDIPELSDAQCFQIAKEMNMPATCFVESCVNNKVKARFFSTVAQLPMCGHGTMCMITRLDELGLLEWKERDQIEVTLVLPEADARISISREADNGLKILLDITPPDFISHSGKYAELAGILGINSNDFSVDLSAEIAKGDFVHLVLPVKNLSVMQMIMPDFSAIVDYCNVNGIETFACFSLETADPIHDLHVRDFCPAVGVAESAGAGTTNAALATYLFRNKIISGEKIEIIAEQGHQVGRPALVYSKISATNSRIDKLQVGGVATKILDGYLEIGQ